MKLADIEFILKRLEIIEQQVMTSEDYFDWFVFRDVILQCISEIRKVLKRYERRRRYSIKHNIVYKKRMRVLEKNAEKFGYEKIRFAGSWWFKDKQGRLYSVSELYKLLENKLNTFE